MAAPLPPSIQLMTPISFHQISEIYKIIIQVNKDHINSRCSNIATRVTTRHRAPQRRESAASLSWRNRPLLRVKVPLPPRPPLMPMPTMNERMIPPSLTG